jgi:hypothetical protein
VKESTCRNWVVRENNVAVVVKRGESLGLLGS